MGDQELIDAILDYAKQHGLKLVLPSKAKDKGQIKSIKVDLENNKVIFK